MGFYLLCGFTKRSERHRYSAGELLIVSVQTRYCFLFFFFLIFYCRIFQLIRLGYATENTVSSQLTTVLKAEQLKTSEIRLQHRKPSNLFQTIITQAYIGKRPHYLSIDAYVSMHVHTVEVCCGMTPEQVIAIDSHKCMPVHTTCYMACRLFAVKRTSKAGI